jgi:VWFA-related protein
MSIRKTGCALVLCALIFNPMPLHAQNASGAFGEVFEVRVTNVDVVATDSKGNPIPGLTKANFEIYEDGKRQEITNFSEITPAARQAAMAAPSTAAGQPAELAPLRGPNTRKFIFYLDGNSLGLKNRTDVVAGINRFLTTNLEPGDQAMIANWSGGSLSVKLPWTSDRAAIEAAVKPLATEVGAAEAMQAQKREVLRLLRQLETQARAKERNEYCDPTNMVTYEVVESQVRSFAESIRRDIGQSVAAMTKLLASLSGVEGKKVLVLATESLPTQAAGEVLQAFESIRQRSMATARVAAAMTDPSTGNASGGLGITGLSAGSQTATAMADVSRFNVAPLVDGLGRAANATGVTVYSINPKGATGPEAGADRTESAELAVDFAQSAQTLDGVNMLARQTGGVAMIGASADDALARLARDLSSYYSIGYRSKPGKSAERKVEVKIKKPGVTARYRNSIYYRSLDTEMSDHVIANHLQSFFPNELGIALQVDPVATDGGHRVVPMRVIIPADSLTLLTDAEGNVTGGFSVFTSTGTADAGGTGVNVQSHEIKWPAAQATQMKGRRIGFAVQVPVDKNPNQISVGVVDLVSQVQGFAMTKIAAN